MNNITEIFKIGIYNCLLKLDNEIEFTNQLKNKALQHTYYPAWF